MKIKQIKISNFRLLSEFSFDVEDNLSLVIGKNNTGKTSFLTVLDKFINGNKSSFTFDDFNLKVQKQIKEAVETEIAQSNYKDFKIQLNLYLEYTQEDNSKNYSKLIMDLDPESTINVLSFEYTLKYENYKKLIKEFKQVKENNPEEDIIDFLNKHHSHYFNVYKNVLEYKKEENSRAIEDKDIKKIINLQIISAKREVANSEGEKNAPKTLSKLSYKYFDAQKNDKITDITSLQQQLKQTDEKLSKEYESFFKPVYKSFKTFISEEENSIIEIMSNLQETNLLKENTSVRYNQDGHNLPEDYNGLGYLNLFAIIFNIHIKLDEFKKSTLEYQEPADINLFFIEEPEAHTHPQMQYIFINNIKTMLEEETTIKNEDGTIKINDKGKKEKLINLQTIISTHSSHIASQSDFNDIKYFYRQDDYSVIVKNLSDLEAQYVPQKNRAGQEETPETREDKRKFQFLRKYLTLNNCDLFFTNKAIFIEGDTERILLPTIMKKFDSENETNLMSQNISIAEVGNYSHVFEKFLKFLDIKALIITDLDSIDTNNGNEKCKVDEGNGTSNASIKHFLKDLTFDDIKILDYERKLVNPKIRIAYQTKELSYQARSFEDAFIALNIDFIKEYKDKFDSLKCREALITEGTNFYDIAQKCIDKKSIFATDILYYSDDNFSNWQIPEYIKEGLKWLAE
ncbi:MAG: AAA family ATPase [Candidatus Gastranaerophilales bacterium]|nr:AAA family ATPase [Candidatus Gastranaerophilales bacterium]